MYLIFNVQGGFENTGVHPLHMVGEGTGSKTFKEVNIRMDDDGNHNETMEMKKNT